MALQALPYVLTLGFLFGSSLIASRFVVGQFHPVIYIGLRTVVATFTYGAIYAIGSRRAWPLSRTWPRNPQLWRHAIVLGIFGTAVPMVGVVSSLQYLSSGVVAILITANPALTILLAHFLLADEPLTWKKGAGVALAVAGTLFIALRGENGLAGVDVVNPLGYILVLGAMTTAAGMNIYVRRFMQSFDAFDVATVRMLTAAVVIMPLAVIFIGIDLQFATQQGYAALIYAAVAGNFLGMFLAFYNVKRFGATAAAMTEYIIPVVAGLGGVLLLNEQITLGMILGMLLIGVGLTLINQFKTKKKPRFN